MQPSNQEVELLLSDEQATAALAAAIAPHLGPGFVFFLSGDLGAGKTTFARALLRVLGYPGRVRSPTFTLVETYTLSKFDLYHFDFYRFSSSDEWRDAGFDEHVGGKAAAIIEWPEMAGASLPAPDLRLQLAPAQACDPANGPRIAVLSAGTERGRRCLSTVFDAARAGTLAGASLRGDSQPHPSA